MLRDEHVDEPDSKLPPDEDAAETADRDEADQPTRDIDASGDELTEVDAGEGDQNVGAIPTAPVARESPVADQSPSRITLGEALSLGMGEVPARMLPDRAAAAEMPRVPSIPAESESQTVSLPNSASSVATPSPSIGEGTQERYYSYQEMRDRYNNGDAQPSTDPRSIFYGISPKRGKTRRLHVEVEVTVANAERIAMIAVEKSKHELKQVLSTHMLGISEKFYAIRQIIRQLSRG